MLDLLEQVKIRIVNMREILTLVACGYPDGALSLSRNLFEQLIILVFFEGKRNSSYFNNYVEDFPPATTSEGLML